MAEPESGSAERVGVDPGEIVFESAGEGTGNDLGEEAGH